MENKIKKLLTAAYYYYTLNQPIMTDAEYDRLYEEVYKFEVDNNIPEDERITGKLNLGYFEGKTQEKLPHPIPMLSLNKEMKEVNEEVVITPKLDGVALELQYRKGVLYAKVTRGNGTIGGDVTKASIQNIPNFVEHWKNKDLVVVRGEVMCDSWQGATHRNYVAGTLGLKDIYEITKRKLYFIAYFLYPVNKTYVGDLKELENVGFTITAYKTFENTIGWELSDYNIFSNLQLPMDGVVVRYNNNDAFGEHTAKSYKNMWAVKFQEEAVPTVIERVDWTQSKNNVWTPVAEISPIVIDGTEIKRVNLASLDYIKEKDICIGDTVLVRKAKGIIPEIVEVVEKGKGRVEINLIRCPSCNSKLLKVGIYLKCKNANCGTVKKIAYFTEAIGIKGLGERRIEQLGISSILDIFSFTENQFVAKLGKVGWSVYDEIQKVKKEATIVDLLVALNPPQVKRALLERIFEVIEDYKDLDNIEKLKTVKGIGVTKINDLVAWYKEHVLLIEELLKLGFNANIQKKVMSMKIAITGSHPTLTRKEFIELMRDKGVQVVENPSKHCKYLVVGDKASKSKIDKAYSLEIPIVSYDAFLRGLKNDNKL